MKTMNVTEMTKLNRHIDRKLIRRANCLSELVQKQKTCKGVQPSGFNITHPMQSDIYRNSIKAYYKP